MAFWALIASSFSDWRSCDGFRFRRQKSEICLSLCSLSHHSSLESVCIWFTCHSNIMFSHFRFFSFFFVLIISFFFFLQTRIPPDEKCSSAYPFCRPLQSVGVGIQSIIGFTFTFTFTRHFS